EEMLDLACPVQCGRLSELCRDRLEVCSGKDHIPHIKCTREQDGPHGIDQMQVIDEDECGDHSAAEEHRDHKDHIKKFSADKFFLGHRISRQQCDKDRDHGKCC